MNFSPVREHRTKPWSYAGVSAFCSVSANKPYRMDEKKLCHSIWHQCLNYYNSFYLQKKTVLNGKPFSLSFSFVTCEQAIIGLIGDGSFFSVGRLTWLCKQECITVGCVPPACCPYLPACTARGGVPAWGCTCPGGWCTCLGGVPV